MVEKQVMWLVIIALCLSVLILAIVLYNHKHKTHKQLDLKMDKITQFHSDLLSSNVRIEKNLSALAKHFDIKVGG